MIPPERPSLSVVPETFRTGERHRRRQVAAGLTILILALAGCAALLVTQPLLVRPQRIPAIPADPGRLKRHVRYLSEDCLPRDWHSKEGLAKAAGYVASAFQNAGGRVSRQVFEVSGRSFANVIGTFGPEAGPRIVVGAHYDACGEQPGADDNASGVACLLEVARALGRTAPLRRVDLVGYTLEESPFFRSPDMGSVRHARLLKEEGCEVTAVIVLEMVGRYTETRGSQGYPSPLLALLYPDRGSFIAVCGRFDDIGLTREIKADLRAAASLPVRSMNGPRRLPNMDFSDHYPYWDQGYPAVMITDTAFYRNGDYHTARDTADRLDYLRMAQLVQGLHAAVTRLAMRAH